MTSAWAFRKAISNLHFDLVVSKLLKITAALSWNWNMLAAPQNFKLKPYIFIPEENLRKERSHGGDCAFFFSRLLCSPPTPSAKRTAVPSPAPPVPAPWQKVLPAAWLAQAQARTEGPRRGRQEREGGCGAGFVSGQWDEAGGKAVCPRQRVLMS